MRIAAGLFVMSAACTVLAVQPRAQEPQEGQATFSAGTQLVEVYATVVTEKGEPITGLKRDDFEVFENGRPQAVSVFTAGEFPLTVALGVDRSFSMKGEPLRLAKDASRAFLRALKPSDRSMVVAIGNDAEVIAPLSADRQAQIRAVDALDPWSTTSLYDAIIATLDRLEPESGRQALIVYSDGVDRYSRATPSQVTARARRSNALIYPIAIGRTRPAVLAELAALTGGRSFQLRNTTELPTTFDAIARELRYQYLLGYAPSQPAERGAHEWRSIRVAVKGQAPGIRVRARDGYTTE